MPLMADARPDRRPVILDVDTGIDDMVALLIAATAPELNLRGVTCVAGNVELQHVARNTGMLLQLVGRGDVPVSIGAARPLTRRLRTAPETHGPTGTGYAELRGDQRALETTDFTAVPAARYLEAHLTRHPGQMTIVATGPLTNVASAANNGVDLAGGAREVIWMGGALSVRGNTTEHGEWNACLDPEAVEICLSGGALDRVFPLDATQQAVFTLDDLDRLPDTDLADVVRDAIRFYVGYHREADDIDGCYLHDPVTLVGALLRPDLVTATRDGRLACDTSADPARAGTIRWADDDPRPMLNMVTAINGPAMREEVLERLATALA
jgi:purine nucleosidase